MGDINVFQRVEKKYRLTGQQYESFLSEAKKYMHEDQYGLHTIHNIYYDTVNYELIRNSIEKPDYKEKFRVRGYGKIREDSSVFLEIKKKYQGVVYKRRICLRYKEAIDYLIGGKMPDCTDQIMKEIDYFMQFYQPEPKLYLAYDRRAYVGNEDDGIRVTIDRNIRGRYRRVELDYEGECRVFEPDHYLMEIKVPGAYPLWLAALLSRLRIYPVSYSKYGNIYKEAVGNGEINLTSFEKGASRKNKKKREDKDLCLQAYSVV